MRGIYCSEGEESENVREVLEQGEESENERDILE